MRVLIFLLAVSGLAACASEPVRIHADRCWSVSAGDQVQGAAILSTASPFTFHVAPTVAGGPACPRYVVQLATDAVILAYDQIEGRALPDDLAGGPKERQVVLSGDVVPGATADSPVIRITRLRAATTTGRHPKGF